jgi:translation initiation factor 2B subunit (eIF-2B alpha/beta/delta family)
MSEAYQKLLNTLQNNHQSGATELALITLSRLKDCLYDIPDQTPDEIEMIVEDLSHARPSMMPLANALRRWKKKLDSEQTYSKRAYLHLLDDIYAQLAEATDKVAEHASALFKPGMTVLAHSRSSQVMSLFEHIWEQHQNFNVIVTLSAPGNEGLLVASQLNKMGVPVTVITDAEMGLVMPEVDINICGCDSWLADHHFVNKTGTLLQALAAQHFGKPFWVLADSFKNNQQTSQQVSLETMPSDELSLPKGEKISGRNTYFETISTRLISGRVDEYGLQAMQA